MNSWIKGFLLTLLGALMGLLIGWGLEAAAFAAECAWRGGSCSSLEPIDLRWAMSAGSGLAALAFYLHRHSVISIILGALGGLGIGLAAAVKLGVLADMLLFYLLDERYGGGAWPIVTTLGFCFGPFIGLGGGGLLTWLVGRRAKTA